MMLLRRSTGAHVLRGLLATLCLLVGLAGAATSAAVAAEDPAPAAVGDEMIAFVEVEDGVIAGGPGYNQGDHSNFSGEGSYTFRETGMRSTMTVTAPAAGVYPVYVRYSAGPLTAAEDVPRPMGLITNGVRQQVVYPRTADWETWAWQTAQVTLDAGANTIALDCDRSIDICRLNFDAIQVGGSAPDPCAATPASTGFRNLFDGTFASFDRWRKAGAGGFGRQDDCSIRSFRGRGAEWLTEQQTAPYTLKLDWRRAAADDESSLYLGSSSRGGADPVGGFRIPIGTDTGAVVPTGGTMQSPDRTAVARALRPVGEWNRYVVQLTSSQVKVYLNGTLVNTYTSAQPIPATGFIGLENRGDGHVVDFRSIQIADGVVGDPDGGVSFVPVHYEFEEGAGTTAANTGTDQTVGPATLVGTTGWSPDGVYGNALDLPGSNGNYVDLPDNLLQGDTDFSVSMWANADQLRDWTALMQIGNGTDEFFMIQSDTQAGGAGLGATFKANGVEERVRRDATTDLTPGTWNHVAFTMSGSVGTLYLDGEVVATRSDLTVGLDDIGPTVDNYLGRNGFPDTPFGGGLDDVRLYTSTLSGQDVAALYADGTAADTTTDMTVTPASPSPAGEPLSVSATVAGDSGGAPQGQAQLWVDGAQVGASAEVVDGAVQFPDVTLSSGTHQLEVRFLGAEGWRDSSDATSHVVERPPLSDGAPVHYTFDEGQGTTAANSGTSSVGPATLTGSATWADGQCAGAVSLPGGPAGPVDGSSHVELPDDITAGMDAEITVSTWIRPTALPNWNTHVQIGKSIQEFFLLQSATNNGDRGFAATLRVNDGEQYRIQLPGETDLPLNEWTHVVVTLAPSPTGGGTTGKIYFDGVLMEGGTRDNIPVDIGDVGEGGTTANFIGNGSWNDPRPTELVDEFRLYGYALSAEQVAELTTQCPAVNAAPDAADDAFATDEDKPLTVDAPGVLGNDSDAEGDTMTATDVTQPADGSVTLAADGSFTYTPDAGFAGTDRFTYRASDGSDTSDPATVTITVSRAPQPPPPPGDTRTSTQVAGVAVPITYGETGSVSVSVSPSSATGRVEVSRGGTVLAAAAASQGRAVLVLPARTLPVGEHVLDLRYGGDAAHRPSSSTVTVTVVPAPPEQTGSRTVVRVAPRRLDYRENFKVVVLVRSIRENGPTPTGKVRVRIDGRRVDVGRLRDGRYVVRFTRNLNVGRHMLAVTYSGDHRNRWSRDRQSFWVER